MLELLFLHCPSHLAFQCHLAGAGGREEKLLVTLESWEQGWLDDHFVRQHSFGGDGLLEVSKIVLFFLGVSMVLSIQCLESLTCPK